ncbi:hypothetical protein ACFO5Q_09725 [Kordiimonas lipolytica]|uniref:PAS domain-containing protein n=1 Tax=Kordiimonas lipolytica TaxID=1662421 RepID=A0ABV8UAE1_9PROT
MPNSVSDNVEVRYISAQELTRPVLIKARAWAQERLDTDGMLDRAHVTAPKLAPFIRHASFFEFFIADGQVTDFVAKVLAGEIAETTIEISGKTGRNHLPAPLFERWRTAGQHLIDHGKMFATQSQVFEKEHKNAESLIVPVKNDGVLDHSLVFTEYWVTDPRFDDEI